jgi:iron-sulfur cluster repair protein YtfE (RIC family)
MTHLASPVDTPPTIDGFEVLDACHRQIVFTLGKLAALVTRLERVGPDTEARALAREIGLFFSTTARQHHEDEERHVFPKMLAAQDDELTQAMLRLQQDHNWLEEDWLEISPQLDAVAAGMGWYDLDTLKACVAVFTALSHDHIALEESLIYPQAKARTGASERQAMGREMAARRRAAKAGAGKAGAGKDHPRRTA